MRTFKLLPEASQFSKKCQSGDFNGYSVLMPKHFSSVEVHKKWKNFKMISSLEHKYWIHQRAEGKPPSSPCPLTLSHVTLSLSHLCDKHLFSACFELCFVLGLRRQYRQNYVLWMSLNSTLHSILTNVCVYVYRYSFVKSLKFHFFLNYKMLVCLAHLIYCRRAYFLSRLETSMLSIPVYFFYSVRSFSDSYSSHLMLGPCLDSGLFPFFS